MGERDEGGAVRGCGRPRLAAPLQAAPLWPASTRGAAERAPAGMGNGAHHVSGACKHNVTALQSATRN